MNETSGEPLLGEPLLGWVAQKSADIQSEGGIDWWGEGGKTAPFGTRYVTSMYGIFNGLENGFTDNEKYFAIFSELIVSSLICKLCSSFFPAFLSNAERWWCPGADGGMAAIMTESLVEQNDAEKEFNERFAALKAWMTERRLQKSYINKVLNYYSNKYKDSVIFDQAELLKELPPAMATSLMKELYGNILASLPFFKNLEDVITTKLAAAAKPAKFHGGQAIIEEGKTGTEMYILIEGECIVERAGVEMGYVNQSGWFFGELPVVNPKDPHAQTRHRKTHDYCWRLGCILPRAIIVRTGTVKAVTDCDIIFLTQEDGKRSSVLWVFDEVSL